MQTIDHSKIIDAIGGTGETAALCAVSSQAVSKWRREGIPRARLMFIQVVRPDAFESAPASSTENNVIAQGVSA